MCDIICTTYNITSTPYVITLLYLWHHNLYIWNHLQYVGQHIHYTCDITATNLCHHTHCRHHYTTLCMTSHSPYVLHFALYETSHPLFMTENHHLYYIKPIISDFISTVFMKSFPLYLTYPLYHNHSIDDLRPTVSVTLHPRYVWHLMHYT